MKNYAYPATIVAAATVVFAVPATADAALGDQTLRQGSKGSEVKELQEWLKGNGYHNGAVDGIYGPATAGSVQAFQRSAGITSDGIAGSNTFSKMNLGGEKASFPQSSKASESSSGASSSVLKIGASGSDVRDLQAKLKSKGFHSGALDGDFGPVTKSSVTAFQRAAGIGVDGVAGPNTFKALNSFKASDKTDNSSTAKPDSSASETGSKTLRQGHTGNDVKSVQQTLKSKGFLSGPADGQFGPQTAGAVKALQRAAGLSADGVVGPNTWKALSDSSVKNGSGTSSEKVSSGSSGSVSGLISTAKQFIGVPYVWGGTTTRGFDCSGFTQYVYKQNGTNLPRTVAQQYAASKKVSSPQVGDMVFFTTYKAGASHNGIYIGNNQFIHAGSSTGVTISSMSNSYWAPRYIGAGSF
ncbi:C40 family peptidase [Marinococcus halophilus]|uniref:C40 family peptidase n=1 Tax=Marinococcus halophilus TaxID=1371 RepID=UPI0009A61EF2|nr:peptidoglycan-binding protein [Marinococcus halophilus]